MNVVIGDVGTGKTTLCRRLIQKFSNDDKVETHLILDPYFSTPREFLSTVAGMFEKHKTGNGTSDWQLKEIINKYLFHQGVDDERIVVLIIDEGQKLPDFCLEILREFLNYETNDQKLLQIIIFAQKEFDAYLEDHKNFSDRINLYHVLGPLSFRETKSMIQFRLEKAIKGSHSPSFFSFLALRAIYRATEGYPRRVINLCHRIILTLIIQNRSKAGRSLARFCIKKGSFEQPKKWHPIRIGVLSCLFLFLLVFALIPEHLRSLIPLKGERSEFALEKLQHDKEITVIKIPIIKVPETKIVETKVPETKVPETKIVETKVPEAKVPEIKIPITLGQMTTIKNDTLGEMILRVYGVYSRKYLNIMIKSNRQIKNPDLIEPGQVISFPAKPCKIGTSSLKNWWVHITTKERLEDAYRFLKINSGKVPKLAIVPCWNSREGLKFMILWKRCFTDEQSAQKTLKRLPSSLVSGAKIQAKWAKDTVFFANPVF